MRNEGSALGFAWYFLDPLLTFAILMMVFSRHMGNFTEQFPLYLFLGIIHWEILSFAVDRAMSNISSNIIIIKSLKVPMELFVVSAALFSYLLFTMSFCIFLLFHSYFGATFAYVWLYPIILFLQMLFVLAVSFFVVGSYAYVHDTKNIWAFVIRLWWFLTPVFYVRAFVADNFQFIYRFNPMYHFLESSRQVLIYGSFPDKTPFVKLLILNVVLLFLGYLFFKRASRRFPERF